jgi:hypothetical protein
MRRNLPNVLRAVMWAYEDTRMGFGIAILYFNISLAEQEVFQLGIM